MGALEDRARAIEACSRGRWIGRIRGPGMAILARQGAGGKCGQVEGRFVRETAA